VEQFGRITAARQSNTVWALPSRISPKLAPYVNCWPWPLGCWRDVRISHLDDNNPGRDYGPTERELVSHTNAAQPPTNRGSGSVDSYQTKLGYCRHDYSRYQQA
jgi:hypothetical protein